MHSEEVDELGLLVACLPDGAEESLGLRTELSHCPLSSENAISAGIPHNAQRRIPGHQQPFSSHQGMNAEPLEVQRKIEESVVVLHRQTHRGMRILNLIRPWDGVQIHGILSGLVEKKLLALSTRRLPKDGLAIRRQGREVALAQLLEDAVKLASVLQGLCLPPRVAIASCQRIEAGVDLLLRHRDPSAHEGLEVHQLLAENGLALSKLLKAQRHVLLQVEEVAEVLAVVEQVALQPLQLLVVNETLHLLATQTAGCSHQNVRVVLAELCNLLGFFAEVVQELLTIQLLVHIDH
mmetsp:Transcript_146151/g.207172  ORF Transcript_146151/g.207172 Transcript_146151/m.207172 type:complete len:294 (+) Transcript_146151:488-1369(+)